MTRACLVDTTRCIGCRSCQVACKQSNGLKPEKTRVTGVDGGYQNPPGYSPYTRTYVTFHEIEDGAGRMKWVFVKRQCMHCKEMRCADVCAPEVFRHTASGAVAARSNACIGCSACVDECPWHVPVVDFWDVDTPHMRKCTFCVERQEAPIGPVRVNGKILSGAALARHEESFHTPACVKACPSGALRFGPREAILAEARRRMDVDPAKYVDHIYGEKELGGLGWLYLAAVPFEKLGLPTKFVARADFRGMGIAPHPTGVLGTAAATLLAGTCWLFNRRDEVRSLSQNDQQGKV